MAELGSKFECAECGTKFYDLGNPSAVCPKCGTAPNRNVNEVERRPPPPRVREPVEEEEEVVVADDEAVEEAVEGEDIEEVVEDAGDED
jgi:uncharacterized protein (TIGR02300 family)